VRGQDQLVFPRQFGQPVQAVVDLDVWVEICDPLQPALVEQVVEEPGLYGGRELDHVVDRRHVLVVVDVELGRSDELERLRGGIYVALYVVYYEHVARAVRMVVLE
jgi:hypothetical protein